MGEADKFLETTYRNQQTEGGHSTAGLFFEKDYIQINDKTQSEAL